jgi:hypothetical protein
MTPPDELVAAPRHFIAIVIGVNLEVVVNAWKHRPGQGLYEATFGSLRMASRQ